MAGGRSIARYGDLLLEEARVAWKIKRVDLEKAAGGIQKREASVVMMDDAREGGHDAAEYFGEIARGH